MCLLGYMESDVDNDDVHYSYAAQLFNHDPASGSTPGFGVVFCSSDFHGVCSLIGDMRTAGTISL